MSDVDAESWLSGQDLRALTRKATESHGGGSIGELVGEVYTVVFSLIISGAVALGGMEMLNTTLRPTSVQATLDPSWLALLLAVVALGSVTSLAGRLGPLGVGGGQAAWWLTMPADRRGLLRPRLALVGMVALAVGAAVGALVGALAGEAGIGVGFAAGVGGAGGLLAVLAVARAQVAGVGRSSHPAVAVGEALVVAAPLIALVVVLIRPDAIGPPSATVLAIALGLLLLGAVGLLIDTERRLDSISGAELRERGAVTAYAAGAVTSLDTRELGRALTITSQPDRRRRSIGFGWVRGPVSALVTGDALVTLRARRQVIAVVVWAVVPIVVTLAGWPSWATLLSVICSGYAAALATAEGARRAEMAPVLDRAFPLEASQLRRVRLIWPGAVMILWTGVTVGVWASLSGLGVGQWLPLAIVAGPVFAAGALRGAYRKPADWSKPLVANPMGPPIPPGVVGAIAKGPDIVVLCLIPLILGMVAVASPSTLLFWQVATTLLAIAIAGHVPDPKGAFAQAMAGSRPDQQRS